MNLKIRKTSEFFNKEYVNWASYDNLRKIGSVIDGQKNAARKILWYIFQKSLKNEIKVSQLDSKVAEETEYLHGSMAGVIVNLARDYIGTNNINLLYPEGNFGTRLINEASAPRYIYTYGTDEFFNMFSKNDNKILEHQYFEGHQIEPKFMLPKLPLILINGSEGLTSGFAQKILPRNPKEIEKYILYRLKHSNSPKKPFKNKPYFRGFKGKIEQGENNKQWIIEGIYTIKGNTVIITELPIGYNLKSYKKILDKLEEQKKIVSYKENCIDSFYFEVKMTRENLKTSDLMDYLKLRKTITENYTVMDEKNKIKVFDKVQDIMDYFIDVKLKYLGKRKNYLIDSLSNEIRELVSKYIFIKSIIEETLIITKRPDEDIIKDLENINKIIKKDDSYDYLLQMPIRSMTQKRMESLMKQIKDKKQELDFIKKSSLEEMWIKDIEG